MITEAWVRLQDRPVHRRSAAVRFASFAAGAAAVRVLAQSGLDPASCRLLDPLEALLAGAGDGSASVLVLGFESAFAPVDVDFAQALQACRDLGGAAADAGEGPGRPDAGEDAARVAGDRPARPDAGEGPDRPDAGDRPARHSEGHPNDGPPSGPAEAWRASFLRAPYLRDALVSLGVIVETFETAVTWDRFDALVGEVRAATEAAVTEVCGDGIVTCRLTSAYPDGTAPYFTVIAPGRRGGETAQWAEIKAAASDTILAAGGTITHHHAVGRDHRRWYDRQRPEPFAAALAAAKRAVDPAGVLNPGVLVDPA